MFFRFFTYGDFPLEGHLEYINKNYLQKFDRINVDTKVPNEPRWQQMVSNSFPGLGLGLWCLTPLSTIFQLRLVLLMEETGVPGENHPPVTYH